MQTINYIFSYLKVNRSIWRSKKTVILVVVIVFCVLGLAAYWPILPWSSTKLPTCACGDPVQSVWFLRWVPYAISHGHNPFYTTWINYPIGANLAQNTLMPLLGLLVAPITLLISPVTSFNFLAWLAFPISAFSMFYVVRYLTKSTPAAFIAGLLYGFSPYMVGQGSSHMMLSFVPLPPLIILTCWKLFVEQKNNPWFLGILLTIEVIAQFFIEPEVLALTAMAVALGTTLVAIFNISLLTKARLIYLLKGLSITALVSGLTLAYPIWFMVMGPNHFTGPNFLHDNPYRSDLIGLVAPTLNEKFVPPQFHHIAISTAGGDFQETGDYIGLPLLLVLCIAAIKWKRNKWLVLNLSLAAVFWVLSLGPYLVVNGALTIIRLPFSVLTSLPLLQNILPARLSLLEWIFVSISVALILVEWRLDLSQPRKQQSINNWLYKGTAILLAIIVAITLLPRWPYNAARTNVPKIFIKPGHSIPANSIALTYPYPLFPNDQAMLWQASAGMRFKLLGGYVQNRSPQGIESEFPTLLSPSTVQAWLVQKQGATNSPWFNAKSASVSVGDIRSFLVNNHVDTVFIDKDAPNSSVVVKTFGQALGMPTYSQDIYVWSQVQSRLKSLPNE